MKIRATGDTATSTVIDYHDETGRPLVRQELSVEIALNGPLPIARP